MMVSTCAPVPRLTRLSTRCCSAQTTSCRSVNSLCNWSIAPVSLLRRWRVRSRGALKWKCPSNTSPISSSWWSRLMRHAVSLPPVNSTTKSRVKLTCFCFYIFTFACSMMFTKNKTTFLHCHHHVSCQSKEAIVSFLSQLISLVSG